MITKIQAKKRKYHILITLVYSLFEWSKMVYNPSSYKRFHRFLRIFSSWQARLIYTMRVKTIPKNNRSNFIKSLFEFETCLSLWIKICLKTIWIWKWYNLRMQSWLVSIQSGLKIKPALLDPKAGELFFL